MVEKQWPEQWVECSGSERSAGWGSQGLSSVSNLSVHFSDWLWACRSVLLDLYLYTDKWWFKNSSNMDGSECILGGEGGSSHLSMEGAGVAGCQLKLEDRWVSKLSSWLSWDWVWCGWFAWRVPGDAYGMPVQQISAFAVINRIRGRISGSTSPYRSLTLLPSPWTISLS